METLTSPSSAILVGDSGSSRSRDPLLRRPESFFRPSHWFARVAVLHLVSARRRAVKPVFSLSPEPQMDLEDVDDKSQETDHSRTVHVKFQIQKECSYGDEFLLVGDDPMLGLWDPDNGIPLTWSDDHVWTAEMDMPIGKTIQYKFVLKESDGTISWQPGPDRIFQSWETINIITVSEEWEDAENQKLIEDDGYTSPNVNSEVSAVVDEKLYPKEELVSKISDELVVADDDKSYPDGKSMSATPEEPVKEKKPVAIVADSVGNAEKGKVAKEPQDSVGSPKKDLVAAKEREEVPTKTETVAIPDKEDKVIAKEPEEVPTKTETVAIPDKEDKVIAKDATTRVAEVKNTSPSSDADKNRTRSVSSPVRVPGLSLEPSKVARTEQAALNQQRKESKSVSDEPKDDAKSSNPPELQKKDDEDEDDDDTHEQETIEMLNNGEEEEDQVNSELMKGFSGNDIIWGFRTVQKLLVNLGLA